jgi:hypothetical protein
MRLIGLNSVIALAALSTSCLSVDFDPPSVVNSVRVFSSRADKPYAKPGDKVELELLAYDGRPTKPTPMQIYWIPLPCFNPPRDLYYLCFAQAAQQAQQSAGNGGADAGGGAGFQLRPGADVTDFLPTGPKYSVTLPADIISGHPPTPGAPSPYGLGIVFNIACAGRVKLESASGNPQDVPLGCYDEAGHRLGADDFVIGFTRVYAYDDHANANPVIDGVTFDSKPVGPEGIVVDRCTKEKFKDCPTKKIGVNVPDASWEVNDQSSVRGGGMAHESIWATYYGTVGRYGSEIRLLFDTAAGRVPDADNELKIPREVGKGTLWIVVRDNRGGAVWQEVPIEIR